MRRIISSDTTIESIILDMKKDTGRTYDIVSELNGQTKYKFRIYRLEITEEKML